MRQSVAAYRAMILRFYPNAQEEGSIGSCFARPRQHERV